MMYVQIQQYVILMQKKFKAMKPFFTLLLTILLLYKGSAQEKGNILNEGPGILFKINYALQYPAGDLQGRFGNNFNLGTGFDFITEKKNFIIGVEGGVIFGDEVKENVLSNLLTPEGFIVSNNQSFADIQLRQRGFYIGGLVGKHFSLSSRNPRSGIRLTVGVGILQHKVRIQEDPVAPTSALIGAYKKGYDRLTNGLAFNQFIGYQLLSTNKRVNFYAGFEFTQGFTQNRRSFDFDLRSQNEEQRIDMLYGFRVGWILPFYLGKGENIYY